MKSGVRACLVVGVCLLVLGGGAVGWGATKKTVTVAADGSGDFKDVQAAVDSAPEGNVVVGKAGDLSEADQYYDSGGGVAGDGEAAAGCGVDVQQFTCDGKWDVEVGECDGEW